MSVVAPPEPPRPEDLEALIREARARQRRRWTIGAVAVATVAAIGLAVWAVVPGSGKPRHARASRPPVGAAVPACRTAGLSISFPLAFAATGHEGGWLRFANTGRQPCLLAGWPSVRVVERNGTTLPVRHERLDAMWVPLTWKHARNAPRLTLGPGESAIAEIQDGDVPPGNGSRACPTARTLRVGVPGDRRRVTISARLRREATNLPLCYQPGVSPFVPLAALPH